MNSGRLLRIGDVAEILGVTTQILRNWCNSGYINAIVGRGGHRRFMVSEVERIMEVNGKKSENKNCYYTAEFLLLFKRKISKGKLSAQIICNI